MQNKQNPLLEPRLLAAVAFIGLGGGIGISLMLARTLIYVGFLICLACACVVIFLYKEHLITAYRALTGRGKKYKGPSALEILIASGMNIALIAVSVTIFAIALVDAPSPNRARLQLAGFSRITYPNQPAPSVNIQINNTGNLNATRTTLLVTGRLESTILDKATIDTELNAISDAAHALEKKGTGNFRQITPAMGTIITLQNIRPKDWPSIIAGDLKNDNLIGFSDQQWGQFEKGGLNLYVMYFARYEDEATSDSYWEASFCGYFTVVTTYWHNCSLNEIRKIASTRKAP